MTKQTLTIRQDQTLSTTDPLQLWDEAASRYLETRRGGPEGNTSRTYGRTLQDYKSYALESGLNPWGADALIAFNRFVNNNDGWANDTKAAKLTHLQGPLSPSMGP